MLLFVFRNYVPLWILKSFQTLMDKLKNVNLEVWLFFLVDKMLTYLRYKVFPEQQCSSVVTFLHHATLVPPPIRRPCDTESHLCWGQRSQKASYLSGACCPGAGGCHAPVTKATGLTTRPKKTG